jgi:hypothetical protein
MPSTEAAGFGIAKLLDRADEGEAMTPTATGRSLFRL